MSSRESTHPTRRIVWRIAGLWMVVLALGLAVIGMILALNQARSMSVRLTAHTEAQAARVAEEARSQFNRQWREALRSAVSVLANRPLNAWSSPAEWPVWIDATYVWDGALLFALDQPEDDATSVELLVTQRLEERLPASPDPMAVPQPELLYETLNAAPLVMACAPVTLVDGRPALVAVTVHLERLRSGLVEPLLPVGSGLQLAPADAVSNHWIQPLFGALRSWVIRPSESFIREQRNAVIGQTLVYLGLTVLALITLLAAMWFLVRVAKHEVRLATMKANFVADVSHELKTPLALIRMFGETLQSGRVDSEEKKQEYYQIITRESMRLTNLIDNILDFSRIEAGRKDFIRRDTDIGQIVREIYTAYRAQLDQNEFEHHLSIEPSLPMVRADPDAIGQAVLNLLSNAIKYSHEERYLAIEVTGDTRRGRRGVLISVHDRGIGIDPQDRARLGEGFFRSTDGRVRQRGGTGLGLTLVKHTVEAHEGSFDVESRLVKGSTFRIFLPAANGDESGGTAETHAS